MLSRQVLINKIETLPPSFIDEVYQYISFLREFKAKEPNELTLASEQSLAKDWLLPEEDSAWEYL
ncbi:MAG: DUF2281 domain-containing protein [Lachnospiraceae bacterium]|jgi:hypothetical protein|nr:DUF2281 domain-containing protein [Lachnospiraceae bacterium]